MKRPIPFPVVAGVAWLACAALAASGLPLSESFTICPFRLLTGHRCPGCGMGHAVVLAMRGRWADSFHHHALGIPLLAVWTLWLGRELWRECRRPDGGLARFAAECYNKSVIAGW
ncbi:MAG: DUF2752 domain-containing protein [Elusimicrobiota bacterium]